MMKKVIGCSLTMFALSANASERPEDPIVWACYMCTEDERQQVALGKGEGNHLVYGAGTSSSSLHGYYVSRQGEELVATRANPPGWMYTQYREFMADYNVHRGEFVHDWGLFAISPPPSPDNLGETRMWGHHVSSLNPGHAAARETVKRILNNNNTFSFLKADPLGRVLRFQFQLDGTSPYIANLNVSTGIGAMEFYFDRDTRSFEYLQSRDFHHPIQESAEDFLAADGGPRTFAYWTYYDGQPYFVQRAEWAGVKVHGTLNGKRPMRFDCSRMEGDIHCFIIYP